MTASVSARELVLGEHQPRADAERNVEALLRATRELVIAGDLNPSAAEIAERAGVGIGTLYRRAVRKEMLLAAVLVDLLQEIADRAKQQATADSWSAFKSFAADYIEIRQVTCSISHALEQEFDGAVRDAVQRTRRAFEELAENLQNAELLDPAMSAEDMMILLASVDITETTLGLPADAERRQRILERILDSLKIVS
ncbi:TetR family transcriptional regulator [Psychromicrobium lacuslunae]|uniref:TetR family transcriptional regulator n=1 Tax=Psychromicrobium lacuslunae TaxID=1618207 RepID=A0A0D4BXD0_9MICC|nr:TetR family transcriptional regulator [Psychromicrobium lacuslunae]AJT41092.1 TetR family transcriptional regulator [Psychromicrobium lacuslunae]